MSSIKLKKDHNGAKAGEIISVPYFVGKQLITKGIGIYPDQEEVAEPSENKQPAVAPVVTVPVPAKGGEVKQAEIPASIKPEFPPQPQPQHVHTPTHHDHGKRK